MTLQVGTVGQLWRYPVSSFAGEEISHAQLVKTGVTGDRRGAYHERDTGKVVFPGIVRKWNLAPRVSARTAETGAIEISLDGAAWTAVGDPDLASDLAAFCGTQVDFKPYGSPYGEGFVTQRYAFSPVHLVSLQALTALRDLLPQSQIDARRFRPNIVADLPGLDGRCPENRLIGTEFTIGGVRLRGIRASGRCSFTTLAQRDLPEDHDVLRSLIHEFGKDFGIYCEVLVPGDLSQGDPIVLAEPERPIVIVGAGQAGAQVARNLRDLGCRQPIQIFGDEPHAPYERPPLSKAETTQGPSHVLPPELYRELDIDLHLPSSVVRIEPHSKRIVTAEGSTHPYDRLVLALGGRPRELELSSVMHSCVHVLRTADDAARLHPLLGPGIRLAIVGAGWLGLELAATGRLRGCEVTVYGRQERILNRSAPAAVASFVEARHRSEGVALRLGAAPSIRAKGDSVEVVAANSVEQADVVVVAIGIIPNDELAGRAGVAIDDGILINAAGQTSDPAIFAAGDVARLRSDVDHPGLRIESWHNANDQAHALARRRMFLPPEPTPLPRFWSTQYDMTIQIAGLPDPNATPIDFDDGVAPLWDFGSFVVGINRPRDIRQATARLTKAPQESKSPLTAVAKVVSRETPSSRVRIGHRDDFPPGSLNRMEVPGLGAILVVQMNGAFHAADDLCPHAAALLSEGFVEGDRIVCPVHFAEFDLTTGQPFNAPPGCGRLRCYQIELVEGELFVLF